MRCRHGPRSRVGVYAQARRGAAFLIGISLLQQPSECDIWPRRSAVPRKGARILDKEWDQPPPPERFILALELFAVPRVIVEGPRNQVEKGNQQHHCARERPSEQCESCPRHKFSQVLRGRDELEATTAWDLVPRLSFGDSAVFRTELSYHVLAMVREEPRLRRSGSGLGFGSRSWSGPLLGRERGTCAQVGESQQSIRPTQP